MITPKNIIKHELIGLDVEITKSKNKSLVGLKGKITDETKNMFVIKSKGVEKKIIKKENTFKIFTGEKWVEIIGELMVSKPEKRTKKTFIKKRV